MNTTIIVTVPGKGCADTYTGPMGGVYFYVDDKGSLNVTSQGESAVYAPGGWLSVREIRSEAVK